MTLEEKIIAFGKAKKEEENRKEIYEAKKRERMIEKVKLHQEQVNRLINLAILCENNGVCLKKFISDTFKHSFGFNGCVTALGFYNGGGCGETDMWLYNNGNLIYPTDYHIYEDGLQKWLREIDRFESAFLMYIDELIS